MHHTPHVIVSNAKINADFWAVVVLGTLALIVTFITIAVGRVRDSLRRRRVRKDYRNGQ